MKAAALTIFALTVAQLALGTFAGGLEQFEGKAFGARLAAYPLMMLLAPAAWALKRRRATGAWPRFGSADVPWGAFALVWAPFLIDVTGNTLDLYDRVSWWDDANHFINWLLLSAGVGLLVFERPGEYPAWVIVLAVTGLGAVLAIAWEVGEYYAFIRGGTELETAYTDTLGDEVLGTVGAFIGACSVAWARRSHRGAGAAEIEA